MTTPARRIVWAALRQAPISFASASARASPTDITALFGAPVLSFGTGALRLDFCGAFWAVPTGTGALFSGTGALLCAGAFTATPLCPEIAWADLASPELSGGTACPDEDAAFADPEPEAAG